VCVHSHQSACYTILTFTMYQAIANACCGHAKCCDDAYIHTYISSLIHQVIANACCGHAKCREDAYSCGAAGDLAVVLATGGSSELLQAACEALKNLCDGHDGCKAQVCMRVSMYVSGVYIHTHIYMRIFILACVYISM
jgi:hypothetical protein